ncbi:hypothetical protein HGG72_01455 [Ochrobactrum pecoris]|nr:hypothetical protein [Brucella pecoris]
MRNKFILSIFSFSGFSVAPSLPQAMAELVGPVARELMVESTDNLENPDATAVLNRLPTENSIFRVHIRNVIRAMKTGLTPRENRNKSERFLRTKKNPAPRPGFAFLMLEVIRQPKP